MWSSLFMVMFVALYAYAGHQTWWRMLVTDPNAGSCGVTAAVRTGTLPFPVYATFVAFWLPLVAVGWLANKL
jgi:hypothetical protein